jgi:hypothetical protein
MPIFEFCFPGHNRIYPFFARTQAEARGGPAPPDNPKYLMQKIVASPSAAGAPRHYS